MRYRKSIEVPVAIADACAYVADFGNAAEWDPGLKESRRIVIVGRGAKAWSRDEVTFEPGGSSGGSGTDSGPGAASTRITYDVDLRLRGPLRLAELFLRGFRRDLGDKALAGLQRTLDARAAG